MKKVLICIVMIFLCMNYVYAENNEIDMDKLEKVMLNNIMQGKESIDISDLKITYSEINQQEVLKVFKYSPYLYQLYKSHHVYTINHNKKYILSLKLNINYNLDDIKKTKTSIDKELKRIKSLALLVPGDYNKALFIHDYLIVNSEYSTSITSEDATSGGLLVNHHAICDGYSYCYQYLLNMLGIKCIHLESISMNHSWNMVKIKNDYYHVDVTWDDPINDRLGMASHTYFMVSDNEIKKYNNGQRHYGWDKNIKCNNTQYDNGYMRDVKSPVCFDNNDVYYISYQKRLMKNNKTIRNFDKWYSMDGTKYWKGIYSGLFIYDHCLYYNTSTKIYSLSLDSLKETIVYELPSMESGYIYGIRIKDYCIEYVVKTGPNEVIGDYRYIIFWKLNNGDNLYTSAIEHCTMVSRNITYLSKQVISQVKK